MAALIDFRPDVLDKALAQPNNIIGYFAGILSFTPATHPTTYLLAAAAETYGLMVAMYWKAEFERPRPSRLSPLLLPPIEPPGHAAFPSGHSTQAHLVAAVLADILPPGVSQAPFATSPLGRMAERIARNREVLGLHYPSDSKAGMDLAKLAKNKFDVALVKIKAKTGTPNLLQVATDEWL